LTCVKGISGGGVAAASADTGFLVVGDGFRETAPLLPLGHPSALPSRFRSPRCLMRGATNSRRAVLTPHGHRCRPFSLGCFDGGDTDPRLLQDVCLAFSSPVVPTLCVAGLAPAAELAAVTSQAIVPVATMTGGLDGGVGQKKAAAVRPATNARQSRGVSQLLGWRVECGGSASFIRSYLLLCVRCHVLGEEPHTCTGGVIGTQLFCGSFNPGWMPAFLLTRLMLSSSLSHLSPTILWSTPSIFVPPAFASVQMDICGTSYVSPRRFPLALHQIRRIRHTKNTWQFATDRESQAFTSDSSMSWSYGKPAARAPWCHHLLVPRLVLGRWTSRAFSPWAMGTVW